MVIVVACLLALAVGLIFLVLVALVRFRRTAAELSRANAALQAEAHQRTRAEEDRNRFFDLSLDLLVIAGMDGRFQQLSPAWEKTLGWTIEELKERRDELVHPDDRESTRREVRRLQQGEMAVVDFENRYALKGGGWRWLSWRAVSVPDKGLIYGVARDISERKRIEQMKTDFISIVSHELRTPLTSIRGALGLVAAGVAGELPEKARGLVDVAARNSDRLARLVNDILDVERIESGQMTFRLVPQDLRKLAEQAVEANQTYGQPHGVLLSLMEAERVLVSADEDRLQQVMGNLLSNAVKFSPRGAIVDVRVTARNGRALFRVTDRGPGIPPEFQAWIFEKFTQEDATPTRQHGGTGLGLSISKAIVERHGGRIWFETATGRGTTFFVELPEWRPLSEDHLIPSSAFGRDEGALGAFDEELGGGEVREGGETAAEGGGELGGARALGQA